MRRTSLEGPQFSGDLLEERLNVASALSAGVNFGLTVFLHEVPELSEQWSFAIALLTAFLLIFFICRYYVFRLTKNRLLSQFWKYGSETIGFRAGEYTAFLVLLDGFGIPYKPVVLAVLALSAVLKFFYRSFIAFPPRAADGGELS